MRRSLRSWLWRVPVDQEVDEELAFHLEMRTRELVEAGMDPAEARRTAQARLGDLAALKQTCVDLGRKRDREMRIIAVDRRVPARRGVRAAADAGGARLHASWRR